MHLLSYQIYMFKISHEVETVLYKKEESSFVSDIIKMSILFLAISSSKQTNFLQILCQNEQKSTY